MQLSAPQTICPETIAHQSVGHYHMLFVRRACCRLDNAFGTVVELISDGSLTRAHVHVHWSLIILEIGRPVDNFSK